LLLPISTVGTFPETFSDGKLLVERVSSWEESSDRSSNLSDTTEGDEEPVDMSHRQQIAVDITPQVLFCVKALVDYDEPDALSFRAGDTIGVTNWDDEVWWKGCIVDPSEPLPLPISTVGTFPETFSDGKLLVERVSSWGEPEPELEPEPEPEPEPAPDTTRRRAQRRRQTDDGPDSEEEAEIWNWHERRMEARKIHEEMMQRIGLTTTPSRTTSDDTPTSTSARVTSSSPAPTPTTWTTRSPTTTPTRGSTRSSPTTSAMESEW
jgi:hypothetical protein